MKNHQEKILPVEGNFWGEELLADF